MCTYVVILRAGRQVILPKRRKLQIARSWTIRKVGEINVATNDPTNVKLFSTYHLSSISSFKTWLSINHLNSISNHARLLWKFIWSYRVTGKLLIHFCLFTKWNNLFRFLLCLVYVQVEPRSEDLKILPFLIRIGKIPAVLYRLRARVVFSLEILGKCG